MVAHVFQMNEKRNSSLIDDVENRKKSQNWKWARISVRAKEDRFFSFFNVPDSCEVLALFVCLHTKTFPQEKL